PEHKLFRTRRSSDLQIGYSGACVMMSSCEHRVLPKNKAVFMPRLVSERIKKLRDEIAEISEANRTQMHRRDGGAAADHERRLQRLQEILDELMTLTD